MIQIILDQLNAESNKFINENNGDFSLSFYDTLDKNRMREATKLICGVMHKEFSDSLFEEHLVTATNRHKTTTPVTILPGDVLSVNAKKWLTKERQDKIGWGKNNITTYRERYFEYLKKLGRNDTIINEARRSTLNIIESLGDPLSKKEFYKKGMVVGSVQSGKTTNFNGVINTAIDSGYKMIIVLAGTMEDLRVQTQDRIEKEVIGSLGAGGIGKGVGKDFPFKDKFISSITSIATDFNRSMLDAKFDLYGKNVLVVKKNVSILRNILFWLKEYIDDKNPLIDIPLLIIDDECDNASLNNLGHKKGAELATKTNAEIRAILALFSKKTYLGYTATPFANVFQDRKETPTTKLVLSDKIGKHSFKLVDNLFPDDFIELLKPPSNYIGIKHFFDTKNDDITKIESLIARPIDIDDPNYYFKIPPRFYKDNNEPTTSKKKGSRAAKQQDDYPNTANGLPKSLKEAINCFILSIAIRESRKDLLINSPFYQRHHTMLVHISLYAQWQNNLRDLVGEFVRKTTNKLNNDELDSATFKEFERVWSKHFEYIVKNIKHEVPENYSDEYLIPKDFNKDIKPLLIKAVENIEIVAINSYTGTDLDYSKGDKKYIAIGGNRLSRGFTLEGLTINYFLRKANTADTLMQMGRWFGYRIGYLDCCKLFTTSDNIDKFNEASKIIEDLEDKFKYLSNLPGRTPRDFTLWVQNNPNVIKLTRANFLKGLSTKSLSFEDTVQQSTQFIIDKERLVKSYKSFKNHFAKLEWHISENNNNFLVHDTDQKGLWEFLTLSNTMLNLDTIGLKEYLDLCANDNKLKHWKVIINTSLGNTGGEIQLEDKNKTYKFNKIKRSGPSYGNNPKLPSLSYRSLINNNIFKARSSTIISPEDFSTHLTTAEKVKVKQNYRDNNGGKTIPDREYRKSLPDSQGVLVIYLMDLSFVFNVKKNSEEVHKELQQYAIDNGIDKVFQEQIPLIGYAIGFPTEVGVNGANYVSQHVHKEPNEMNVEELKEFISIRDFDIDLSDNSWTTESLLEAMYDNPEEEEDYLDEEIIEVEIK